MSGETQTKSEKPELSLPEQAHNSFGVIWEKWEKLVNTCNYFKMELYNLLVIKGSEMPLANLKTVIECMRVLAVLEDKLSAARPKYLFNIAQEKIDVEKVEMEMSNFHIMLHDCFFVDNYGLCRHIFMLCPDRKEKVNTN